MNIICVCRQLSLLNECYESVFTKGCGASSSRSIIGLMADAFKDPYYLRYKYRPNCEVHGITTIASTLSTTSVQSPTSTKPSPKSLDERSDDARAFSDARASNGAASGGPNTPRGSQTPNVRGTRIKTRMSMDSRVVSVSNHIQNCHILLIACMCFIINIQCMR